MLREILKSSLLFAMCCAPAFAQENSSQSTAAKTIIVFDASGSMWGQINGVAKISMAKDRFSELFNNLNDNSQVGLIAYGHNRKADCNDIETLVPVGSVAINRGSLKSAVGRLSPKGKTPLSKAVRKAAEDLKYEEDAATVVLVTDGIETCDADPCALANELESIGVDFRAHVVGFGLSENEGRQVACLAENTGGLYLSANNADQLAEALEQTVLTNIPEPTEPNLLDRVTVITNLSLIEGSPILDTTSPDGLKWFIEGPLDESGVAEKKPLPRGTKGGLLNQLSKGKYRYSVNYKFGGYAEKIIETGSEVEQSEILPMNAARIEAFADLLAAANESSVLGSIEWRLQHADTGDIALGRGTRFDFYVPDGRYKLSIKPPRGKYEELAPIDLNPAAGDVLPANFVLPHGKVNVTVREVDGSVNKKIRYGIRQKKEDGTAGAVHRYIAGPDPVYAMPGSYVLVVELWDGTKRKIEQPIEVGFSDILNVEVKLP